MYYGKISQTLFLLYILERQWKKINILSLTIFNENKRMDFGFNSDEKFNSVIEPNIAYIHQIKETDFYKW